MQENQTDIMVTPIFDFPTVYMERKPTNKSLGIQTDLQLKAANQELLLEAKKICIELVYEINCKFL